MKRLVIFFASLLGCLFLMGPSKTSAQIVIDGEFDEVLAIDSFEIVYATNFAEQNNIYARGKTLKVNVHNSRFRVELIDKSEVILLHFKIPTPQNISVSKEFKQFITNPIMMRANTITKMNIAPSQIVFHGEERAFLSVQMDLFNLRATLSQEKSNTAKRYNFDLMVNEKMVFSYLNALKQLHDSVACNAHVLIAKYRDNLDSVACNLLFYNFLGNMRFYELNQLSFMAERGRYELRPYVRDFYIKNFLSSDNSKELSNYIATVNSYSNYLAYKVNIDLSMMLWQLGNHLKPQLSLILDLIAERFSGNLFDQVAFSAFLNSSTKEYIDENTFFNLLSTIKTKEYTDFIELIRNRKSKYSRSFQFQLRDEHDKIYQNTDFFGKVVVFDFWFTGCKGCMALHANMAPVKSYFKDNPNVLFVSVCVDTKEAIWKKSLMSGNYTDEEDVNLWVGEENSKHPMIRHYNISSYPTMIIVNANDEVIAVNPVNPIDESGKAILIKILEQTLYE